MRNVFVFFTVVLLCGASALRAQNTYVQIGTGIDTSEYLPTNVFTSYSLSQQIYTASEIGQAGTIYSIAFYNVSPNVTRNLDVYLAHTSKTAFSNGTDWSAVTTGDLVFSGTVTFMQDQWGTVEFTTPFVYNGTDNLLVVVDDNAGNWIMDRYFRVFNAPNQVLYDNDDFTDYDPTLPIGYNGTVSNVKNQIQLSFATAPCPAPSSFTVSNIGSTSATLSWIENGDATAWDIRLHGFEDSTFTVYTNPYTLTDLTPNMPYSVMMRANCGDSSGVSAWLTESFITSNCSSPSDLFVSNINPTNVTLNWTDNGNATVWEISLNGDEENVITVYTNPHVLTGLTPSTYYNVSVRAICGDNNVSSWTDAGFTTLSDYQVQSTANWYGYNIYSFLEEGGFAHYDWDNEFISFSMQNPSSISVLTDMNLPFPYTYAVTYANGYVWCITCADGHLCRASINNDTQTISDFEIIVPYFEVGSNLKSMSYNPVDGRIYYITTESLLRTFHPSHPDDITDIGFLGVQPTTLAINNVGNAYIIEENSSGNLYQLNLSDASVTLIGSTGLSVQFVQSMAFDQNTGELFWTQYYNPVSSPGLYLVDPVTAETQLIGKIGEGGCQLAGLFMVDTSHHVGVPTHLANDLVLYPNPANDVINVQCTMNNVQEIEAIEVLDVYGKVVRTVSLWTNNINVSGLAAGLYFVRVTTDTGTITKPFIKN